MTRYILSLLTMLMAGISHAQFAPQVGVAGTTAIPAGSPLFKGWATHCTVQRGLQVIGDMSSGYTTSGDSTEAIGAPNGTLVSLGDSGVAVLTFANPLVNGQGADFAVFENGFPNPGNAEEAFLELAFVEVSSDGINYTRFPATSLTQDTAQLSSIAGQNYMNARLINNLAGKYTGGWGTPFDLQELAGTPGLDVNHITHVRIVDCIGTIGSHAAYDAFGHKVNDPFPTAFPTGGFDLDAVGVINQSSAGVGNVAKGRVVLYPNPATDDIHLSVPGLKTPATVVVTEATGRILHSEQLANSSTNISVREWNEGIYYIHITGNDGSVWTEKLYRR